MTYSSPHRHTINYTFETYHLILKAYLKQSEHILPIASFVLLVESNRPSTMWAIFSKTPASSQAYSFITELSIMLLHVWCHVPIVRQNNMGLAMNAVYTMWARSSKTTATSQAWNFITWLSIMKSWAWCHSSIVGTSSYSGICHDYASARSNKYTPGHWQRQWLKLVSIKRVQFWWSKTIGSSPIWWVRQYSS